MPDCLRGFNDEELIDDLRAEWEEQIGGDEEDPFAETEIEPLEGTTYEVQPVVDSLGVVRILLTIERRVGFDIPPCIIRRGGYHSFEEMVDHLLPKIRALQVDQMRRKVGA